MEGKTMISDPQELLREIEATYASGDSHPVVGPARISDCVFVDSTLHCLTFDRVDMSDVTFYNCDLRGADWSNCRLNKVKLCNCQTLGLSLPSDTTSEAVTSVEALRHKLEGHDG